MPANRYVTVCAPVTNERTLSPGSRVKYWATIPYIGECGNSGKLRFGRYVIQGIYLFSSERSGSNLLRRLLGNHPKVSAPVPPHLFSSFHAVAAKRGDLSDSAVRLRVLSAMRALANHPFSDWNLQASADEIDQRFRPNTFVAAVDSIYRAKAAEDGKAIYVCKENFLFRYAKSIQSDLERIRWLYLYRDPRDVVASWLRNRMRYFSVQAAAVSWRDEQQAIDRLIRRGCIRAFPLSYEALVTNPRREMTAILQFLGLNPVDACFENYLAAPEARRNRLWRNLASPVTKKWVGSWRSILKAKHVRIVEAVCVREMEVLGYQPLSVNKDYEGPFFESLSSSILAGVMRIAGCLDSSRSLVRSRERLRRQLVSELISVQEGQPKIAVEYKGRSNR